MSLDYTNNQIRQRCEGCDELYLPRQEGDLADLNQLCRRCAEECAAQLSRDYNLPLGCSDEERQLALNPPEDKVTWVLRCDTVGCARWNLTWSTVLLNREWTAKYGHSYHCFFCGESSTYIRSWRPTHA